MRALILSTMFKRLRGWTALSLLLICLLGTHWIGFAHNIAHSGIQHQSIEQSCSDQSATVQHGSSSCHLFDALTLAGFIASEPASIQGIRQFNDSIVSANQSIPSRPSLGLYQSRAPPLFIL